MKHRHYNFVSTWHVSAPVGTVEAAILDINSWKQWWDGLEDGRVVTHNGDIVGGVITCTWKSLAGYHLTMRLTITDYLPQQRIVFRSDGDLVGEGSWAFQTTAEGGTQMDIAWNVTTTKTWMNLFGPVLRPLFVQNHHILMCKGEQGLQEYVG